jgi:hypothetical protein
MKNLYYRAKNFVRTGSFSLPSLTTNISSAIQADLKLAKANTQIEAHEAAITVKNIALTALKDKAHGVAARYSRIEADTDRLLAKL